MRFTAFCKATRSPEAALFKALTGIEPNRVTKDNAQALVIEEGKHPEHKGSSVKIVQHGARIDVVVEAAENAAPTRIEDISLEPNSIQVPIFTLAERIFSNHSDIVRIAFAANLFYPIETGGALATLKGLLPHLSQDLERASEVTYKINRITEIDGILFNRLSNWEIARLLARAIGPGQAVLGGLQATVIGRDFGERLSLEVECNTDAARTTALETQKLGSIFERLVRESATIAKQGHK